MNHPKQLVSELRQPYMDKNGVKYEDSEYKREGATELVMINEPLGNHREVRVEDNHTGKDLGFNNCLYCRTDVSYPPNLVTLVMDNLSAHKVYNLYKVFEPAKSQSDYEKIRNCLYSQAWLMS